MSMYVCVSVSVCLSLHEDSSGTTCTIFNKRFVHVAYGYGLVLLWFCCDTLCTPGFVDGIFFF